MTCFWLKTFKGTCTIWENFVFSHFLKHTLYVHVQCSLQERIPGLSWNSKSGSIVTSGRILSKSLPVWAAPEVKNRQRLTKLLWISQFFEIVNSENIEKYPWWWLPTGSIFPWIIEYVLFLSIICLLLALLASAITLAILAYIAHCTWI